MDIICNFKSGIILKNKIVLAEGDNESHTPILEELGIADDYLGATKKFVRVELVPKDREWWVDPKDHPEHWRFVVDQDVVPDWFDRTEKEKEFRLAVCEWWDKHVLVDQKIDTLETGYFMLKRCEVKKLCNDVKVMLDRSTVNEMWDSSTVNKMRDSSTARNFKKYPKIEILVPDDQSKFTMVFHKNE